MNNTPIKLTGTHSQIGLQIGELYRDWGKKQLFLTRLPEEILSRQLAIYEKHYPEYIDLLKGVAEGSGLSERDVLVSYTCGYLAADNVPTNTCSVLAANVDGKTLIARNYDWREASEATSRMIEFNHAAESYSFKALSDMGSWQMGTDHPKERWLVIIAEGWNEKGLYICINGAPGPSANIGMNCVHIVQLVLERCASTKEAIKMISKVPCNDPKIFTVADKEGDLAVIEKPADRPSVAIKSQQRISATNHYQSEDLREINDLIFEKIPFHSTFGRLEYLKTRNPRSLEDISSLIARPPVMQNWRGIEQGDTVTTWTLALELKSQYADITFAPLKK